MNSYSAISDIGYTLVTLLREGFKNTPEFSNWDDNSIILFSPGEISVNDTPKLCLFLYQVVENPQMKNREMEKIDNEQMRYPGLILDLHYLLIPYPYALSGVSDKTEWTKQEHRVLGRAMQIFHDNAMLRDPLLKGNLIGKGLEIKLILNPFPLDEMTKLWHSFQTKPYKPSVCYLVTPVVIESERIKYTKRVLEAKI